MPLITPPTVDVGMGSVGRDASQRAIARIAGPLKVGVTLYKDADGWHQGRNISNNTLTAAEVVLLGGHWHLIDDDTYDAIVADGIAPTVANLPDVARGLYPGSGTFPASNLYPGA